MQDDVSGRIDRAVEHLPLGPEREGEWAELDQDLAPLANIMRSTGASYEQVVAQLRLVQAANESGQPN